jgi:hypothetical protein
MKSHPNEESVAGCVDLEFPRYIVCHLCGGKRRVIRREVCEMPEGMAGVAWANCRKCRHTFVRFIGEKKPAARLMQRWLGLEER